MINWGDGMEVILIFISNDTCHGGISIAFERAFLILHPFHWIYCVSKILWLLKLYSWVIKTFLMDIIIVLYFYPSNASNTYIYMKDEDKACFIKWWMDTRWVHMWKRYIYTVIYYIIFVDLWLVSYLFIYHRKIICFYLLCSISYIIG